MTTDTRLSHDRPQVAIIGAGIAGLSCARSLAANGYGLTIFDRGRGPGGRVSTRLVSETKLSFDHGAPSFQATHPEFKEAVDAWVQDGVCQRWIPTITQRVDDNFVPLESIPELYVGIPHMNAIPKLMASNLVTSLISMPECSSSSKHPIRSGMSVLELIKIDEQWALKMNHPVDGPNQSSHFDAVVLAVPPGNTLDLLENHSPELSNTLQKLPMHTTWVLMLAIESRYSDLPDVLLTPDHPRIVKIVSTSTKPARTDSPRCLTVYAQHKWSLDNRKSEFEPIRQQLLADTLELLLEISPSQNKPSNDQIIYSAAHRWGYAEPVNPATRGAAGGYLSDDLSKIVVCNDALSWESTELGIQSAWLSGKNAALCIQRMFASEL